MSKTNKSNGCGIVAPTLISIVGICLTAFLNYYFVNLADKNGHIFNYIEKYRDNYSTIIDCKEKIKSDTLTLTSSFYLQNNSTEYNKKLVQFKKTIIGCKVSLTSLKLTARALDMKFNGFQCALNTLQTFNNEVLDKLDIITLKGSYTNPHESIDAVYLQKFGNEWNKCLVDIDNDFNKVK